jgi:hypothetical protein
MRPGEKRSTEIFVPLNGEIVLRVSPVFRNRRRAGSGRLNLAKLHAELPVSGVHRTNEP